jgi:hypothetical protein
MVGLMKALPEMWLQTRAELLAFADFLTELNSNQNETYSFG